MVEPMHSGHHTNYLLALVPGIESLKRSGAIGSAIFSVTPHHFQLLNESGDAERVGDVVEWDPTLASTPPNPSMRERAALHESMQSVVARHRADALICTTADYDLISHAIRNVLPANGFWPSNSAGVIHFGLPKGNLSKAENGKRIVYEMTWKLSKWKRLLMVNPLLYEGLLDRGNRDMERYSLLPDPVPELQHIDRDEGRDRLGLARDGIYVGCVGMMDQRKAVPELIKAFLLADFNPDVRLVLAGRIDSDYRRVIDSEYAEHVRSGRFILLDRTLSDIDISCGFAALDLHSVLQYRRFNLSANVLKCVASGKPFVCDDIGFASMVARRFDAGLTCDVRDIKSISAALTAGIKKGRMTMENAGTSRLLEYHSYKNFAKTALASVIGADVFKILGPASNWADAYGQRNPIDEAPNNAHHLGRIPARLAH